MNYTIRQIESALLAALAPLGVAQGGVAKTITAYEGQFDDAVDGKDRIIVICPAILVTYAGAVFDPDGAPMYARNMRWATLIASRNPSSGDARRTEAYDLLDAVRAKLNGTSVGLDITPLRIEKETLLGVTRNITVYRAEYTTTALEDATLY